jgi:Ca2+-binding EF-hand superfamily protein
MVIKALKAENYVFNTNNLHITKDDNRLSTFDETIVSNQANDTAMSRYVREVVNGDEISDINEPTLQRDGINNLQTNSDNAFIKNIINNSVDDEIETAIVDDNDIDDEIDDFLDDLEDSLVYEFVDDLIMNIDRNALLNYQEFSQIVISLYQDIRKDEIEQIFKMLDKSNDGFVSYTEILPLINYLQKQKSEQERGKNISRDKFTKNKVSVSIDTKFRSDYFKQSSSSFNIEIPEIQKNVTQIPPKPLANATIPIPKNITQNTSLPTNSCVQRNASKPSIAQTP